MISDKAMMPPPPKPWTATNTRSTRSQNTGLLIAGERLRLQVDEPRAAINMFMFFAAPAKALPIAKNPMLDSITGCRPKMLLRPPETGMKAAEAKA